MPSFLTSRTPSCAIKTHIPSKTDHHGEVCANCININWTCQARYLGFLLAPFGELFLGFSVRSFCIFLSLRVRARLGTKRRETETFVLSRERGFEQKWERIIRNVECLGVPTKYTYEGHLERHDKYFPLKCFRRQSEQLSINRKVPYGDLRPAQYLLSKVVQMWNFKLNCDSHSLTFSNKRSSNTKQFVSNAYNHHKVIEKIQEKHYIFIEKLYFSTKQFAYFWNSKYNITFCLHIQIKNKLVVLCVYRTNNLRRQAVYNTFDVTYNLFV